MTRSLAVAAAVLAALGAACAKPDRTLIDAIERKDVAAVQAILDKSPARAKEPLKEWRKTAKSSRGSGTAWQKEAIDLPLLAAARAGSVEIATLLLDKGADANGALAGKTPLQVALASGPPEMVKLLVARGARLDGRDEEGWTALHYAARSDPADVQAPQRRGRERRGEDGSLGDAYADGQGVAADPVRASGLLQGACDRGDGWGCARLGYMLLKGQGLARDVARGKALYAHACQAGYEKACALRTAAAK
jgi:TPR repeat protein